MSNKIKSGKEVIDEFFANILNVKGTDGKTIEMLIGLHNEGKLTDSNIQNALEELKQAALNQIDQADGKD